MQKKPVQRQRSQPTPMGGGVVGFVFGLAIGSLFSTAWGVNFDTPWLLFIPPLVVGLVGAKYGDRFWQWFLERLSWFS